MDSPYTIVDMLYSGLVPAVVAFGVWFAARRFLKEEAAARLAPTLALVIAFSTGYWLQWWKDDHQYWLPKMPYDWLPVLVAFALVWGPVVHARGVSRFERLLAYLVFGLIVAWFLVPTRKDVQPMRWTYVLSVGPIVAFIAFLFDGICERFRGPLLPAVLAFSSACMSVILLLSGSTSFPLTVGACSAALGGITLGMLWTRDANLQGISWACCTLLCGIAIIARFSIRSDVPLASYLIVPLAPLLMWAAVKGPLAKGTGFIAGAKKIALPVIACLTAVALAAIAELGQ